MNDPAKLVSEWQAAFFYATNSRYCLKPLDWRAAKLLLSHFNSVAEVLEVARSAWTKLDGFLWTQSQTMMGFYSKVTEIKAALAKLERPAVIRPKKVFVSELREVLKIKRDRAQRLKNGYCREGPASTNWSDETKRQEYRAVWREIRAIETQIENAIQL